MEQTCFASSVTRFVSIYPATVSRKAHRAADSAAGSAAGSATDNATVTTTNIANLLTL